jgi:hypothetical protein
MQLAALHRADQGASHATTFRLVGCLPGINGSPSRKSREVVLDFATEEQPSPRQSLLFGEASFDAQRIALDVCRSS